MNKIKNVTYVLKKQLKAIARDKNCSYAEK